MAWAPRHLIKFHCTIFGQHTLSRPAPMSHCTLKLTLDFPSELRGQFPWSADRRGLFLPDSWLPSARSRKPFQSKNRSNDWNRTDVGFSRTSGSIAVDWLGKRNLHFNHSNFDRHSENLLEAFPKTGTNLGKLGKGHLCPTWEWTGRVLQRLDQNFVLFERHPLVGLGGAWLG